MAANDLPDLGVPARLAARMSMPEQHAYLREKLRRRARPVLPDGPSRRGVLRGGGLLAAGAAGAAGLRADTAVPRGVGNAPGGSAALLPRAAVDGGLVAPFGRHLAFGADPASQMRISWQVPLPVRRPYLRVGTAPWDLGGKVAAEVRALHTPALNSALPRVEQLYLHVGLEGLRPGTTYYYGVGHDGSDPAAPERSHTVESFTTAPADGTRPFVFTAFGDQGVSPEARTAGRLLLGRDPAFHLHAGDICYADGTGHGEDSDRYDARMWDRFLAQIEPVARRVPWMVTTGNHDMEAWYSPDGYGGQTARWSLPADGPDPERAPGIYSFVYGNVGVVALDANDVSYEIPANRGCTGGAQTRWLERTLVRLRARRGVDFVVVFFHHCAYSTATHGSDGGVRERWVALFERHHVDLVVNGHNHVYERTDPLRGGRPTRALRSGETTDPVADGTVYVTAGGGGRKLYDFRAPDSFEGHVRERDSVPGIRWSEERIAERDHVEWSRVRYTGFSFLAVESRPGPRPALSVTALAQSGRRIDHFAVRRR
ncbi:metallophosphoesterase family protein [Streptomyces sp. NPDC007083]|uniref:purple acid phosphatase family protein n=1 Tax=Streptomyces sp. NPDC007083 TaxID=3156913 RepID=UPI0033F10F00